MADTPSFKLSPEDLAALRTQMEEQAQAAEEEAMRGKPFTGETYAEGPNEKLFLVDRMETPITEDEMDDPVVRNVVESEEYQALDNSGARNAMIQAAVDAHNEQEFTSRGEPLVGGEGTWWEDTFGKTSGIRTQTLEREESVDNPDFDPNLPESTTNPKKIVETQRETFFVPKPGAESSWFTRTVSDGVLETAKTIGRGGEWVTDSLGITDPDTDYVKENFPTYAPRNALEAGVSEVTQILIGAGTGAGAANALNKAFKFGPKVANQVAKMWDDAKKIDPKNAKQRFETALNLFIAERGANVGATFFTPEGTEPLVGDWALEQLGMDAEENERLGHYIDNEAFSASINILARIGKAGYGFGKKLFRGMKNPDQIQVETGLLLLKELNPELADVSGHQLAEHARILGEVIQNNKDFRVGFLGNMELDSGTALMLGAREYVERAYAWRKPLMEPKAYEEMVTKTANTVAENMVAMKQAMRTSEVVRTGENAILSSAAKGLDNAADDAVAGGRANADIGVKELAQETLEPVTQARRNLYAAEVELKKATAGQANMFDKDMVIQALEEARKAGSLGADDTQRALLEQMTGPELYEGWLKSYNAYSEAFRALPKGVEVDVKGFRDLVLELSDKTNKFSTVTMRNMESDPFRLLLDNLNPRQKMGPDGSPLFTGKGKNRKPVMETEEELLARIGKDVDLKFLYTDLRPAISRRMDALEAQNMPIPKELAQLKQYIDEVAEKSDNPEFLEAMGLYEKHANTYMRTKPLQNYNRAAGDVVEQVEVRAGESMGQLDAYEAGMRLLNESFDAQTTGYGEAFLDALSAARGGDVSDDMASAFLGMAIKSLQRSTEAGGTITAGQVRTAVEPYLKKLSLTNKAVVARFEDTISKLEMAQTGLGDLGKAVDDARAAYDEILVEAQEDAASAFIRNIESPGGAPFEDISTRWNEIFRADDAPEKVAELMRRASMSGNQLAVDGIKSRYLSHIKERIFTKQRTGITGGGTDAVNEVSPAQLANIVDSEFDNTISTLREVFKDEPQKAQAVEAMLDILNISVNNRAVKRNTFGSDTMYNNELKKTVDRLIVLTLGVLNPAATKARNLSALLIEGKQKQIAEAIQTNMQLMITSPTYMNEVMGAVAKGIDDKGLTEILAKATKEMTRATVGAAKDGEADYSTNWQAVDGP